MMNADANVIWRFNEMCWCKRRMNFSRHFISWSWRSFFTSIHPPKLASLGNISEGKLNTSLRVSLRLSSLLAFFSSLHSSAEKFVNYLQRAVNEERRHQYFVSSCEWEGSRCSGISLMFAMPLIFRPQTHLNSVDKNVIFPSFLHWRQIKGSDKRCCKKKSFASLFLFISYCVGARRKDDDDDEKKKENRRRRKKGKEKILMIYVNHDNKNAEAKNIPRGSKFIAFYFDANAREELRRCSVPIPVSVSRRTTKTNCWRFFSPASCK